MKTVQATREGPLRERFVSWLGVAALAVFSLAVEGASAQTYPGKALVRAVQGIVNYTDEDGADMPLKAGILLHPGTVLKTDASGSTDLEFDGGAGTLRLRPQSALRLDKLAMQGPRDHPVVTIQLNLTEGELLGRAAKLPDNARYEIQIPQGIAGVRSGLFRLDAKGQVMSADGLVVFAYVAAGAQPVAHTLTGSPGALFTPDKGVQVAPAALTRDVAEQLKSKLRKR